MDDDRTRTRTSVAAHRDARGDALSASDIGPDRLPTEIGKYRVAGYLGRGGMGVVLSAHDTELDRPVALKLLHSTLGDKARTRMEREAQAMAKLAHPNVVTVYDFGRAGDLRFIAMELVTGVTLRDWFRREKRSWRRTLAMMIAAGRGLEAAHAAGMVHRDFKPDNVLVGADERPRVTDFGLVASSALEMEGTGAHDGPSVMGGTPAYMPPEQWDGGEIDARADQYAFAVTCWEALWGKRPVASRENRSAEPERIRDRRGVPKRVEEALRRALDKDRSKRWPELSDLLSRLELLARKRRPVIALGAVAMIAVVGVVAFRVGGSTSDSPCRGAGTLLDNVWAPGRIATMRERYARQQDPSSVQVWDATERVLQAWADEHRAIRIETCELGRTGASGMKRIAAARAGCLEQRLGVFEALVTALEQPDATSMAYARAAALGLPTSAGCRSATSADPVTTAGVVPPRENLAAAHQAIARATALRSLGKPRESVALTQPVAKNADDLGWQPLVAEAYLELGLGYQAMHESEDGEKALQRAVWFADASRDDDLRFQATIGMSENAMERSSYDEAARLIEDARMIARRFPDSAERDIEVANQLARLAFWRGEFSDCVARSRDVMSTVDKTMGRGVLAAQLRLNLARCLQAMGKTKEYGAPMLEALDILETTIGREHPYVSDVIMGLGLLAREEHRPAEALTYLQEALSIRERVFGPENPEVAKVHNSIGNAYKDLGRPDEARRSIERALSIWEKSWGPDSPAVALACRNLGRMAMERGDLKSAEPYLRRSLEILRKTRPSGHPDTANSMLPLAELLIAKRDRSCLPLLREAVASYTAGEPPPEKRDEAHFLLGRALYELGVDRVGGRKEMAVGCAAYDAANDPFDCRAYLTKLAKPAR